MITGDKLKYVVEYTAKAVTELEDELNSLDRAIGDGDHGYNMSRGFHSVLANLETINYDSVPEVFVTIGNTLVSSIGGASGALYGSLLIRIGNALPAEGLQTMESFVIAFEQGVVAIKELGCSDINQKTMLDVIIPVLNLLKTSSDSASLAKVSACAEYQSQLTIEMRAEKGRASFLGDRSIGHLDPGARSSQAIISSICRALTLK